MTRERLRGTRRTRSAWGGGRLALVLLLAALLLPAANHLVGDFGLLDPVKAIFLYAILGLGLNVVMGFTGLLHLGIAAFMAIGVYAFAILTADIYPFQLGFWPAMFLTLPIGAAAGFLLGAPTLGLRGDYLAIVTLGFGEITQDVLKNLDTITNGTQGINPVPPPTLPWFEHGDQGWMLTWYEFQKDAPLPWYYLFLALLVIIVVLNRNLEHSRIGRAWMSVREDDLASKAMGIPPVRTKILAFATAAALAAFAGGLWASSLSSSGEPANYDFQVSILALCIVIVGGMGNITGVLIGAIAVSGANDIVLQKLFEWMQQNGWTSTGSVFGSPNNWKFLMFGLALILMMRFKPDGLVPARRRKGGAPADPGPAAESSSHEEAA
ncbi:MAG: branched-chain amino acid ABC transporter permease [Phycisphaerae bacterium]|nr:branched-chain amino acid ABC transporter permease [Phycisphaerae bacterium]